MRLAIFRTKNDDLVGIYPERCTVYSAGKNSVWLTDGVVKLELSCSIDEAFSEIDGAMNNYPVYEDRVKKLRGKK